MLIKKRTPRLYGTVEAGFENVMDAFRDNFERRGETGAACAVSINGRLVVDLWGGYSDPERGREWESDTLVPVFSSTKGFAALAAAVAHSRGRFSYDDPVAKHWPEFARNGKERITIRQLLAHQAGLSALDAFRFRSFGDLDTSAIRNELAAMKPAWTPGTAHGYHTWTIGWFIAELVRRTDPRGRSLGAFLQEEIAGPLEAEFYIGLPPDVPDSRLAKVKGIDSPLQLLFRLHEIPVPLLLGFANPKSLTSRSMMDADRLVANGNFNRRDMLAIEFPSGNGVGNVRGMANIYGTFASGGSKLRLTAETLEELRRPAVAPANGWFDLVNRTELGYSLGFWKPIASRRFGNSLAAYGHPGAGGSFCFADPDIGLGYAYAMNQIGGYMDRNPRENALRKAVYSCL
ncbi:serine hydrolase domain-containing protein [Paenibacillus flagellatus]|uniref:EstA family serine hydrolase n=1 Tax=Paenibacillus flagellatus TaxID=2211139 RepID=A0A2V5L2H5_9BACL|nr:serine hydrolase domain-containing protein [Paenibacillus flagellatus]PYI56896.1 EstA family serine hydrolase [Paenibacillus flagellatus]